MVREWDRYIVGTCYRTHSRNEAFRSQRGERLELGEAVGTIGDAGVFMDALKRSEEPELVLHNGTAERADVVLPRERLPGQGGGILDWVARVECRRPFVKGG